MNDAPLPKPYHDLGGDAGGPVLPDQPGEAIFAAAWHKRVLGLTVAGGAMGAWSIDASRFRRESLPKADYQSFTYYEKWLAALTNLYILKGFISRDEIENAASDAGAQPLQPLQPLCEKALKAPDVAAMLVRGAKASRPSDAPMRFDIGQAVITKLAPETLYQTPGHTRLPTYAAGKTGKILFQHGHHVLPNSNAHFLGECPEALYSVEFLARDLWQDHQHGDNDTVIVDCWDSYLDPA